VEKRAEAKGAFSQRPTSLSTEGISTGSAENRQNCEDKDAKEEHEKRRSKDRPRFHSGEENCLFQVGKVEYALLSLVPENEGDGHDSIIKGTVRKTLHDAKNLKNYRGGSGKEGTPKYGQSTPGRRSRKQNMEGPWTTHRATTPVEEKQVAPRCWWEGKKR